jgi:hypothetical protein
MRRVLAMLFAGLFCLSALGLRGQQPAAPAGAGTSVHDGTWWKEKSTVFREAFIVGYKEGVEHATPGTKRSVWTTARAKPLMDGMNDFYKDFRNSNIYVDEAMGYVQDELQGTLSDDALKAELQKLRQVAAARKEE